MEKLKDEQAQEYLTLITSVFPNCLWRFVEDDIYCGFEFAPEPGVMLVFKFIEYRIRIEAVYYSSSNFKHIMILNGSVPGDSNCNLDFDFIKKILVNYKLFSRNV